MSEKMNAPQLNAHVKAQAVECLRENLNACEAVQTDDFSFDIPVEVDGAINYVRVDFTARNMKGTTKTAPFDLASRVAAWEADKAEKAAKAEADAAKKAATLAKAKAKAKKVTEE